MKYLLLLALLGCRSPMPDEIGYTLGHGESDFNNTARTGMDTTYGAVTITYHLGKDSPPPAPAYDAAYEEWLWDRKISEKSPADLPKPIFSPEPKPDSTITSAPEPAHVEGSGEHGTNLYPYLIPLILGIAAALVKKEH